VIAAASGRCDQPECAGARLEGDHCLQHLTAQELDAAVARLRAGEPLDARDVSIGGERLAALLAALRDGDGRPVLPDAAFDGAVFSGGVDFDGVRFRGDALFRAASFGSHASFRRASFSRKAGFEGARFDGDARFDRAVFHGSATFDDARFGASASFIEVSVRRDARFPEAGFDGDARFDRATFGRDARFHWARFGARAGFEGVRFKGDARYDKATFGATAAFDQARCSGRAAFDEARFGGRASFMEALFGRGAHFLGARFAGDARFGCASFGSDARFHRAHFGGQAGFELTHFAGDARFDEVAFDGSVAFNQSHFQGVASFVQARHAGDAAFSGARFAAGARFTGAAFSRQGRFDGATFGGRASFELAGFGGDTTFDRVRFHGQARFDAARFAGRAGFRAAEFGDHAAFGAARFGEDARFDATRFDRSASFGDAEFAADARFESAGFVGGVAFDGARLHGDARFDEACFRDDATFAGASFGRRAGFRAAVFGGDAAFTAASFERTRELGPLVVRERLVLDDCVFGESVTVEAAAVALSARATTFAAGALLRVRWAEIALDMADFGRSSTLWGATTWRSRPDLHAGCVADARRIELEPRPRLITLRGAHVTGLALSNVDLRACRFFGAHGLESLSIESGCHWPHTPPGRGCIGRDTIAEEHHWRGSGWDDAATQPPGWLRRRDGARPLAPPQVAALYRALRKAREDTKDEAGAGDLYYGEMEMRRHAAADRETRRGRAHARSDHAILTAYWLVAGYGLKASRSVITLALVVLLASAGLHAWGFAPDPPYLRALLYSMESTTSLVRAPAAPGLELSYAGEAIHMALRVLGPLLLGLTLLALRSRVKR
jgi:hypothetical protein